MTRSPVSDTRSSTSRVVLSCFEPEGREFESLRARHIFGQPRNTYSLSCFPLLGDRTGNPDEILRELTIRQPQVVLGSILLFQRRWSYVTLNYRSDARTPLRKWPVRDIT